CPRPTRRTRTEGTSARLRNARRRAGRGARAPRDRGSPPLRPPPGWRRRGSRTPRTTAAGCRRAGRGRARRRSGGTSSSRRRGGTCSCEPLAEEGEHPSPRVGGRLRTVRGRPGVVHEGVARARVEADVGRLPGGAETAAELLDVGDGDDRILVPVEPEKRAAETRDGIERRARPSAPGQAPLP